MFDNLFVYFGPVWASVALFGVVLLLFVVAASETIRLVSTGVRQRPCLVAIRLMRMRQRLVHAWVVPAHNVARWTRPRSQEISRRRE